jgi:site-specific DNA-cytosine methylase
MPVDVRVLCDKKPSSISFLKQKVGSSLRQTCMFDDVEAVTAGCGHCHFHGGFCNLADKRKNKEKVDLVVLGPPCQPYSWMRHNRKSMPPHRHPDFDTIFMKTVDYLKAVRPRCGIMEQVKGFAAELKPEDGDDLPRSWLVHFLELISKLGYVSKVFSLDNKVWSEAPRERCTPACLPTTPSE